MEKKVKTQILKEMKQFKHSIAKYVANDMEPTPKPSTIGLLVLVNDNFPDEIEQHISDVCNFALYIFHLKKNEYTVQLILNKKITLF